MTSLVHPSTSSVQMTSAFYSFLVQEYYYLSQTAASIFLKHPLALGALLEGHPFVTLHLGYELAFYHRSASYASVVCGLLADAAIHSDRLAIFSKIDEHS